MMPAWNVLLQTASLLAFVMAIGLIPGCAASTATDQASSAASTGHALLVPAPGAPIPCSGGALAAGDVNGDGCADLLVSRPKSLMVFFGSGDRAWPKDPDVSLELTSGGNEIALADLNHDRQQDVVIADHDSYAVTVLLGSGDGRFKAVPGSPFVARDGNQPHTHGLALADFNADGHLDIVTANNNDGDISLLLGDGSGKFTRAHRSPFPCGKSPYPIAAADINGDGHTDVLIPNAAHGDASAKTLTVLLGNQGAELTPAASSPIQCEATPWYVAVGDLNDDERPDVVATHIEGKTTATILLNDGSEKLTPAAGSPLQLGHGAWGAQIADVDRDGKADVVVAAGQTVRVFVGDGRGGFQPAAGSPYQTGKGAWRLVMADFNGDGKPDAATRCVEANQIEILYGN